MSMMRIDDYIDDIITDGKEVDKHEEPKGIDVKELTEVLSMKIDNTINTKLDAALKKLEKVEDEKKEDNKEDNKEESEDNEDDEE